MKSLFCPELPVRTTSTLFSFPHIEAEVCPAEVSMPPPLTAFCTSTKRGEDRDAQPVRFVKVPPITILDTVPEALIAVTL